MTLPKDDKPTVLLKEIRGEADPIDIQLASIGQLRQAMTTAITNGDWPAVARLDRLCGQMTERMSGWESGRAAEFIDHLLAIRGLYARLLLDINRELLRCARSLY